MLPNLSGLPSSQQRRAAPTGGWVQYHEANEPVAARRRCNMMGLGFHEGEWVWHAERGRGGDDGYYDMEALLAWAMATNTYPYTWKRMDAETFQALKTGVERLRQWRMANDRLNVQGVWAEDKKREIQQRINELNAQWERDKEEGRRTKFPPPYEPL